MCPTDPNVGTQNINNYHACYGTTSDWPSGPNNGSGNMQNADGGWGWFSGFGEQSWPHTTATVVHGLQIARENDLLLLVDAAQTAGAGCRFINSGVNTALAEVGCKDSKKLAETAESTHQTVPNISIHPIGEASSRPAERDHGLCVQLVDPHSVFEKAK